METRYFGIHIKYKKRRVWRLNRYNQEKLFMLSTQYRLKLEFICKCIANGEEVKLDDMVWAQKLAKANTSANEMLKMARRQHSQNIEEGTMDDFMNRLGLGDPDPSNHKTGFDSADDIKDRFQQDKPKDWRQRD